MCSLVLPNTRYVYFFPGISTLPLNPRARFLPREAQVFDAEEIIVHPQYNRLTFDFDIALVSELYLLLALEFLHRVFTVFIDNIVISRE